MRKILLSSVALVGFTTGAMAADIPRRVAPPPVFAPVPVFTWTGFYVGLNAGYGWSDSNDDCLGCFLGGGNLLSVAVPGGTAPVAFVNDPFFPGAFGFGGGGNRDGFVGGAQVGWNYQFTPGSGLVIGIEADIQWADLGGDNNNAFFGGFSSFGTANTVVPAVPGSGIAPVQPFQLGNVAFFNNAFDQLRGGIGGGGSDWFATVRARVGWAWDRVLVYATGGIVFTENGDDNVFFNTGGITSGAQIPSAFYISPAAFAAGATVVAGAPFFPTGGGREDIGWTLGGGVEWAFTNNLTFKIEGLWIGFDREDTNNAFLFGGSNVVAVSNTGAPIFRNTGGFFGVGNGGNDDVFIARAGLNWKFGW
jgi:outer membrane immunogenic protein